ncbi:MAG: hypothetical protein U9N61_11545 [Euryarchaeota archaeon]|nr:hypothetical protein [Euryarchaeota archaeon]
MKKCRHGIAEAIVIALIVAASSLLTVVLEKETNNYITKVVYPIQDANVTKTRE